MQVHKTHFEVRDNEIDIQGIVNNANYFVYLTHARHQWALSCGINFSEWSKNGRNLVVLRSDVSYKHPLKPNDKFYVSCEPRLINSHVKFEIYQQIHLEKNDKIILTAVFTITCINEKATRPREKLYVPDGIKSVIESRFS